jgi:hypothetical protein
VLDRFAREVAAGRYPGAKAAMPDLERALEQAGVSSRRGFDSLRLRLGEKARALGWSAGAPRYAKGELAVFRRVARAMVRGEYPSAGSAVPRCRQELAKAGMRSDRTTIGLTHALWEEARALGWGVHRVRWRAGECRIGDRFALAVAAGKYRDAAAAVADCRRALRRLGPVRLSRSMVQTWLARRARQLGRPPVLIRLTPVEKGVLERFARAVAGGEYPGALAAVGDCRREMVRAGGPVARHRSTIHLWLMRRAHALGWTTRFAKWTTDQDRVLDHYVSRVVNGEYPTAVAAARTCGPMLKRVGGPAHGLIGIAARIAGRAHKLGLPLNSVRLSPVAKRRVERLARDVVGGRYRTSIAAARVCRSELARDGAPLPALLTLSVAIRRQARKLGMDAGWTFLSAAEKRAYDRLARAVVAGRYPTVDAAARAYGAGRSDAPAFSAPRASGQRSRTLAAVRTQIKLRAREYGQCPRSHFSASELALIDSYARAAVNHRFSSAEHAAAACRRALSRMHRTKARRRGLPVLWQRGLSAVHRRLLDRVREIGRFRLGRRAWEPEEARIALRWAEKYRQHRLGRSRVNAKTAAEMMREQLDRLGYYRTFYACRARIEKVHAGLIAGPATRRGGK